MQSTKQREKCCLTALQNHFTVTCRDTQKQHSPNFSKHIWARDRWRDCGRSHLRTTANFEHKGSIISSSKLRKYTVQSTTNVQMGLLTWLAILDSSSFRLFPSWISLEGSQHVPYFTSTAPARILRTKSHKRKASKQSSWLCSSHTNHKAGSIRQTLSHPTQLSASWPTYTFSQHLHSKILHFSSNHSPHTYLTSLCRILSFWMLHIKKTPQASQRINSFPQLPNHANQTEECRAGRHPFLRMKGLSKSQYYSNNNRL